MQFWLKVSRGIDAFTRFFGRLAMWLILAATFLSAINALVRKMFNVGSNALLEAQWYLYAAAFLIAAALTLRNNEHVRIDILISRFSPRTQAWMDLFGIVFMMLPVCLGVLYFSLPFFWQAYVSGEMSSNSGGLIRWPVYLMIPVGFTLLLLQGVSEAIKRIAFLEGALPSPFVKESDEIRSPDGAEGAR
ncbi:MAG: TRAP transporter small permease subunit [Tepidiphilus sp.]|jgi:TRAP-type mannitol/chloroaromatic compound transport system permease small subunit|nr:TRAP transporter small permease subunit [Tepidiphilus sp.]MDD3432673.1 TRAP transporter small permease subunit [Tepidiphilus sp.]